MLTWAVALPHVKLCRAYDLINVEVNTLNVWASVVELTQRTAKVQCGADVFEGQAEKDLR